MRLTVVTLNVFHDYPLHRHLDRRLAIVLDALAAQAPHVVALQEVSISKRHGDFACRLVTGLRAHGLEYAHSYAAANGSVARGGEFEEGSAILSRWPILDAEARELAPEYPVHRELHGHSFVERRIAVRAALDAGLERPIQVVSTHVTDSGPQARERQIETLEELSAEHATDVMILAGDLNATPEAPEIARLRRHGFVDPCVRSEPGFTIAANRDLESPRETANRRIDYVLVRPGPNWIVDSSAPCLFLDRPGELAAGRCLWASDHNGIAVEVVLRLREGSQVLPAISS